MRVKIKFIFVGKLKKHFWVEAERHYRKLLSRYYCVDEIIIKDAPGHLPLAKKLIWEGERILSKIGKKDFIICLDEKGKKISSLEFAKKMTQWCENKEIFPCFVIGGAHGLSPTVKERANVLLSLGNMTLPHEMARIIMLEQLYRAQCILYHHPYHH